VRTRRFFRCECPHGQGGDPIQTYFGQRRRRNQFFAILCGYFLWAAPNHGQTLSGYQYPCSKNDIISLVRKHCALGLELGLAEIRFRSNVFSSKCRSLCLLYTFFYSCRLIIMVANFYSSTKSNAVFIHAGLTTRCRKKNLHKSIFGCLVYEEDRKTA